MKRKEIMLIKINKPIKEMTTPVKKCVRSLFRKLVNAFFFDLFRLVDFLFFIVLFFFPIFENASSQLKHIFNSLFIILLCYSFTKIIKSKLENGV